MAKTPISKTQPKDGEKIKRSVLRVLGLNVLTSGIYNFYWFFVTKNQLKRELNNEQHVGWQTVGLIVPILNAFILYWIYRDINRVRDTEKLSPFAAIWYVVIPYILISVALVVGIGAVISIIGAIGSGVGGQNEAAIGLAGAGVVSGLFALLMLFIAGILQFVFMGLAVSKLNEFWDARTGGKAAGAGWGKGEIAVIVVGVLIMISNVNNNQSMNMDNQDENFSITTTNSTSAADSDEASAVAPKQIYDQVQNGMTTEQVKQIAGREPDNKSVSDIGGSSYENWTFQRGGDFITITFTNGAVSSKSSF